MGVNQTTYDVHIFRTENAWQTATPVTKVQAGPGSYNGVFSVFSFGTDTLVMVPNNKNFYHYTTNGGQSWVVDTLRDFGKTITAKIMSSHFSGVGNYIIGLDNSRLLINSTMDAKDTSSISIRENKSGEFAEINLYPNPAKTHIQIQMEHAMPGTVYFAKIYDLSGRVVSENRLNNNRIIPVENLEKGMYILHIYNSGKMLGTSKFIRQ